MVIQSGHSLFHLNRLYYFNMVKTYMIPARYMEQDAIEAFLGRLFGYGKAQVTVSVLEYALVIAKSNRDAVDSG